MTTPLVTLSLDNFMNKSEFEKNAFTRPSIFLLKTDLTTFLIVCLKVSATLNHVAIFHAPKNTQATAPIPKNSAYGSITMNRQISSYEPAKRYRMFSQRCLYKS